MQLFSTYVLATKSTFVQKTRELMLMKLTTGKFSKYLFEHIQVFNAVLSMFLLSKRHFIDFYSYPRHIIEVLKIRLLSKFQSLPSDLNVIFVEILGTSQLWRYQNIFHQILVTRNK